MKPCACNARAFGFLAACSVPSLRVVKRKHLVRLGRSYLKVNVRIVALYIADILQKLSNWMIFPVRTAFRTRKDLHGLCGVFFWLIRFCSRCRSWYEREKEVSLRGIFIRQWPCLK
jgi:hypothetical protein